MRAVRFYLHTSVYGGLVIVMNVVVMCAVAVMKRVDLALEAYERWRNGATVACMRLGLVGFAALRRRRHRVALDEIAVLARVLL